MNAAWTTLLVALLASQDAPLKLKFQVEHFNLDTKKAAPLKADEAKSFAGELKGGGFS